jgi:hypothetical protein
MRTTATQGEYSGGSDANPKKIGVTPKGTSDQCRGV